MGGQLLRVAALTCILLTMTLEPNFVCCEISTNDTGIFRMVPESFRGYDYLPANVQDGRSVFTCAASCLQADHCTGFVFDQNLTACQLVTEYCGGSMFRPTAGQLYTSKGSCSVDDGYHFVDIGIECEYCIRVSNQSVPGLSYEEARNACMADGGNLLHFEELRGPDFQNLLQLSDTTEFADSYWIGVNTLNVPGQLSWDYSDAPLTQTELNVLELYEPAPSDVPVCIYMSSYFQEYYTSNCSYPRGYICLVDT